MTKYLSTYLSFTLIMLFISVSSCKKDHTVAGQIILTPEKTDITPFEIIGVEVDGVVLQQEEYSASIAGVTVLVSKSGETSLAFMVPGVQSGSAEMQFNIEGNNLPVSFNVVGSTPIQDPEQEVQNLVDDLHLALDSLQWLSVQPYSTVSGSNYQSLLSYVSDFETAYAQADQQEIEELAMFMSVNPDLFDLTPFRFGFLYNDSLSRASLTGYDGKFTHDAQFLVGMVVATAATTEIFTGTLLSGNPLLIGVAGSALFVEMVLLFDHVDKMWGRTYVPFLVEVENMDRSTLYFTNGQSYSVGLKGQYRSLLGSDIPSSNEVSNLADAVGQVAGYWNTAQEYLDLDGQVPLLSGITDYRVNPDKILISSEYLSINNISPSSVQLNGFNNTGDLDFRFQTSSQSDVNFSFDITYDNPWFDAVSQSVDAVLENGIPESVIDIDGNVYGTVIFGDKVWMGENLKTTRYSNGTSIPNLTSDAQWTGATSGGWCNYDNNSSNDAVYGKLYNGFVFMSSNNVCPDGWHVSTKQDWDDIAVSQGYPSGLGARLKETGLSHWNSPNTGATDEYGFTALPGGSRSGSTGNFWNSVGDDGYFWTSTLGLDPTKYDALWYKHDSADGASTSYLPDQGLSIRCVMD